jgi:hypothetical protein
MCTDVSEESAAAIFHPEDGAIKFLQHIFMYIPNYKAFSYQKTVVCVCGRKHVYVSMYAIPVLTPVKNLMLIMYSTFP